MIKITLCLLIFLLSQPTISENGKPQYEPATLKASKFSIQNLIKFPKSVLKSKDKANVVVRCDASISRAGKFLMNFCYENSSMHNPYLRAINSAAKRAIINPGRVNDAAKTIWYQYYVLFSHSNGQGSVEVISNSGLQVNTYGLDYTSAQRYKEGRGNFGAGCGINKDITVNAIISSEGVPKKVDVVSDKAGEKCKRYLKENFMDQRFIPASYKGRFIDSFYSEKIFDDYRNQ